MIETLLGKKIALVGGAGFVGHHLALALRQLGAQVEVIDSLQINNLGAFAGNEDNISKRDLYLHLLQTRMRLIQNANIPLHILDARDYQALSPLIGHIRPEVVIQLAAVAHASKANKSPYSTFDHSLRTLENALDASRSIAKHFIYLSSSMIYGNFTDKLVTEESVAEPIGIYGALKYAGEKMVIAYNQVFGLPYTIIRPSALYGERCVSRRVGQIFIENALDGLSLTVHGTGEDALDFTYIEDFVSGIIKVITNENAKNETLNMTYGSARSIKDLASILQAEFGDLTIQYQPKDSLMPDRGTLSVAKARKLIGYDPQFPIERGFVRYINWYKSLKDSDHGFFKSVTLPFPAKSAS